MDISQENARKFFDTGMGLRVTIEREFILRATDKALELKFLHDTVGLICLFGKNVPRSSGMFVGDLIVKIDAAQYARGGELVVGEILELKADPTASSQAVRVLEKAAREYNKLVKQLSKAKPAA